MNKGSKLTRREAGEIRVLAKQETTPQKIIAWAYEITQGHVSNIKTERRWPPRRSRPEE